jgi:rhodanese-related sulfurtransferase
MRNRLLLALAVIGLLALVPAGLAGCGRAAPTATPAVENVTVAEAHLLIDDNANNPDFIILDVRTPQEYADGHLVNAVNINLNSGSFNVDIAKQDKGKTYLVYCSTGVRSASASSIMIGLGFMHVNNMTGGITDWIAAGYTTTK